jgi:hypothetical protein
MFSKRMAEKEPDNARTSCCAERLDFEKKMVQFKHEEERTTSKYAATPLQWSATARPPLAGLQHAPFRLVVFLSNLEPCCRKLLLILSSCCLSLLQPQNYCTNQSRNIYMATLIQTCETKAWPARMYDQFHDILFFLGG